MTDIDRSKRVGVLMGGLSSEREISLKSGKAVLKALQAKGWDAVAIDVGRDLVDRLRDERVEVCWIALHGRYGEDGCVQGTLELLGIPYTNSGVRASAIAMDKPTTKALVRGLPGVVLARDAVVRAGDPLPDLPLPVIVKPADGGSTVGTTIVRQPSDWDAALAAAAAEGARAIVEELVPGDEITVAVVDGVAYPVVRIVPDSGFFDFEAKYTKGRTRYEVPAAIDAGAFRLAQEAAVAAYRAVGCRGLARVDFMVRDGTTPVFLEVNTIPGCTETSLSPMAAGSVGIPFEQLVETILLGARLDAGA